MKTNQRSREMFELAGGVPINEKITGFRKLHKQLVGFGHENSLMNQRAIKRERLNDQRHRRRSELFSANRDTLREQETKKVDKGCKNHLQTLAKWREERNRRKLLEKIRTKPPFKVGIVRHRWYSPHPPIIKDGNVKNKQKRENMRNKKNKVIKLQKVSPASVDYQFKVPASFTSLFERRAAKKREKRKNYLQNIFDDSIIKFLPKEFDTSPVDSEMTSSGEGATSIEQEKEERVAQYLLSEEMVRLIGLCDSLELTKNEESITKDIYHFIEGCHVRFKKLEELEENVWADEEARKDEEQLKKNATAEKAAVVKKKPADTKSNSLNVGMKSVPVIVISSVLESKVPSINSS